MQAEHEIDDLRAKLAESEKARTELERLNQFSRELSSTGELDDVLERIFDYISDHFGIDGCWLLLADQNKKYLYTSKVPRSGADWPPGAIDFVKQFKLPLNEEVNSFTRVMRRRRPLYFPKIENNFLADVDRQVTRIVGLQSVLLMPLIMDEEAIGIVSLTNHGRPLALKRADIAAIGRFCHQIAGAVYRSSLYDRIQRERAAADRLRQEIETLNDFSRKINASTNLDEVLDEIFAYLENTFGFEAVILGLPEASGESLYFYRHSDPDYMSDSQREFLKTNRVPLDDSGGAIAKVFQRQKPYYQSRIPATYFESDRLFVETMKPESLVMVPLVIKERSIGLLLCTSRRNMSFQRTGLGSVSHFAEQIAGAIYSTTLLDQVKTEQEKSDSLLRNILPVQVAEEIKDRGSARPTNYEAVTVLFTDFVGFTNIGAQLSPGDLVKELDGCFTQFDDISARHGLEKLKTIGDAYMCAGGLPIENKTHAIDACLAALEYQAFMERMKEIKTSLGLPYWELRIGIHSGPVTAGVVGKYKFAYDIWGDSVNTASRCESAGLPGRINISEATRDLVADYFECEERGRIPVKAKGKMPMFFLLRLIPAFAQDPAGLVPNETFQSEYAALKKI